MQSLTPALVVAWAGQIHFPIALHTRTGMRERECVCVCVCFFVCNEAHIRTKHHPTPNVQHMTNLPCPSVLKLKRVLVELLLEFNVRERCVRRWVAPSLQFGSSAAHENSTRAVSTRERQLAREAQRERERERGREGEGEKEREAVKE